MKYSKALHIDVVYDNANRCSLYMGVLSLGLQSPLAAFTTGVSVVFVRSPTGKDVIKR